VKPSSEGERDGDEATKAGARPAVLAHGAELANNALA
jgi:hypothetical protein